MELVVVYLIISVNIYGEDVASEKQFLENSRLKS